MNNYVVGFAFTEDKQSVLLVSKLRPDWQIGFLNGIGGKIEDRETPLRAMNRECYEETGLILNWSGCGIMHGQNNDGSDFTCLIFKCFNDKVIKYKQIEDEQLSLYLSDTINQLKVIENLKFIIPFILCEDNSNHITVSY